MKVIIACSTDDDPKEHEFKIDDSGFNAPGWVDITVEDKSVTVWAPELQQAILPFVVKYSEDKQHEG